MSVNGFFAEYPYNRDVAVSPAMEKIIGRQHINARITNARYEGDVIVADCIYEGKTYTAKSDSFLDQQYWLVIR